MATTPKQKVLLHNKDHDGDSGIKIPVTEIQASIIILVAILFCVAFLFGLAAGHLTYDKVKAHEHEQCLDQFSKCKELYDHCRFKTGVINVTGIYQSKI